MGEPFAQMPMDGWMAARVLMSLFCGTIVGLERQIRGKPVGIRTSVLITVSTMAFIQLGNLGNSTQATDPTRVLGQLVTGVGFLGAGVILTRNGAIEGVTSAACIWLLSAVGAAIGFDQFRFAMLLSVIAVSVLIGVEWLERAFFWLRQGVHAHGDERSPQSKDRDV